MRVDQVQGVAGVQEGGRRQPRPLPLRRQFDDYFWWLLVCRTAAGAIWTVGHALIGAALVTRPGETGGVWNAPRSK